MSSADLSVSVLAHRGGGALRAYLGVSGYFFKGVQMLRSMRDLKLYTIGATDGEIGHVSDFFFDGRSWVIRYLVIETGSWLLSRKVLLSPYALMDADWMHKRLPVRITREQVKNSPDVDTDRPVSRQHEIDHATYYGYPGYWAGEGLWGNGLHVPILPPDMGVVNAQERDDNPNLRSCKAVLGYTLHAIDGDIGHVQDMLVDEDSWAIRYLVVQTSSWWLNHQVLIAPNWFTDISWDTSTVSVDVTRQAVKDSPSFDSTSVLNRHTEDALHQHYGRIIDRHTNPLRKEDRM